MERKLTLNPPIVNACGIESYLDRFARLDMLGARYGAYIPKSFGPREKQGNLNPTVAEAGGVMLNSFALPTHDWESWENEFNDHWVKANLKTDIIGSVWGDTPEDYVDVIRKADSYVVAWQLNVSCPNFEPGEKSVSDAMGREVKKVVVPVRNATKKPVIVKLSPNGKYVEEAEAVSPYADYICCGNTVGPGLDIDIWSRRPVLAGQFGGLSGKAMMPLKLKMTYDVYTAVGDRVGVWASGGIETWEDVAKYALAGAEVFEIGTVLMNKTAEEVAEMPGKLWDDLHANYLDRCGISFADLVGSADVVA